ncbi:uncharacterized protein LOC109791022 [Cajanus cajan]|uniref:DUF538 domain-containing protein n=1 Tax=Cajanus cajan TaxID=3821 RepID=A0A151R0Q0_CAJCA|nr:uncharacterized protein LOC109791022 [Cajanus cajan]KYP36072.1 hypothetical protein KK1_042846 [Cajanus cajan]
MASPTSVKERAGAEIVYGPEECRKRSTELLQELGFPSGVLPLKDLIECGRVHETGFVWMKQKEPSVHFLEGSKSLVRYGVEVTAYVEKSKMKRMSGVKSKQVLVWVPISEMSLHAHGNGNQILFKTPFGVGKSFPVQAFFTAEEEKGKNMLLKDHEEIKDM